MSMTILVTRNAPPRVRGFLASAMLELSPGVYSAPRISPSVRERIWSVVATWLERVPDASIVMIWQERDVPGGQAVRTMGVPPIELIEIDGVVLARRMAKVAGT